jgi:F-type H+-transporting ATPase subunit b
MISTAWAADAHGGGGLFSDPTFWVAVAFFLFLAIAGKTLAKGLTKILDDRTALIARTLGDAEKLRAEAQKARDDAQKSLADSAKLAQEILAQAKQEAERLVRHAAEERTTLIGRREQQAKDRIAQAEAQATREVRNMAVDVALAATRTLLKEQVGQGRTAAMIDEAISELPKRLH